MCPCCGEVVAYHRESCSNGRFIGFPNVRVARAMRRSLVENYDRAVVDAASRGVTAELQQIAALLEKSCATINLDPKIVRNLAMGQPYHSYYVSLSRGERQIAKRQHHAHRAAVDAKIHTGYENNIVNLALSPDGRGLSNYGAITLIIKESVLRDRSSVLRENAFKFYERHSLGDIDAEEEPGWRSAWVDRAMLGIACLELDLVPEMSPNELSDLILHSADNRHDDRYIEVHLFGNLVREFVSAFYLAAGLATEQEGLDWQFCVEALTLEGAEWRDNFDG